MKYLIVLMILILSCSKKEVPKTTRVTFVFDDQRPAVTHNFLEIANFDEINCFAVMATYPELPPINFCSNQDGVDFLRPDQVAGMVPFPGGDVVMDVLIGDNRKFDVLGWKWEGAGACPPIFINFENFENEISEAFVLGVAGGISIDPSTEEVVIELEDKGGISNYDKVTQCRGPLFDWGGTGPGSYFDFVLSRPGVVAYWSFDDPAGSPEVENHVGGNNGSISGADLLSPEALPPNNYIIGGKSLGFVSGNSDYVTLPVGSNDFMKFISDDSDFTISLWTRFITTGSDQYLLGNVDIANCAPQLGFALYLDYLAGSSYNVSFKYCNVSVGATFTHPTNITDSTWYHILVEGNTDGGGNTEITIAIDGNASTGPSTFANAVGSTPSNALYLGQNPTGGIYYNGFLDEVVVFNRQLDDKEAYVLAHGMFDGNLIMTCTTCGSIGGTINSLTVESSWQLNTTDINLSHNCPGITIAVPTYDNDQDLIYIVPSGNWPAGCSVTLEGSLTTGDSFSESFTIP